MNPALLTDLDRLLIETADTDLSTLLGELAKRIMARQQPPVVSLLLRDTENQPVGYFVPQANLEKSSTRSKEEFVALMKCRIANPPERFLSTEEFLAALDVE